MKKPLLATLTIVVVCIAGALVLAVVLGGPSAPSAMASANNPFDSVDYSGLPEISNYAARDGQALAFRRYDVADPKGSAVLLHGLSADSLSMHLMAQALADSGFAVHALDVRGHGALFDHYLLLAPFVSHEAPTYRSGSGGWVDVGLPRYVALAILNQMGIERFNHLPVVSYALNERACLSLTPQYSFNLAESYRPQADYVGVIRGIQQPTQVLVGMQDEMFLPEQFVEVFGAAEKEVPVTLVEGADHVGLTLMPQALEAVLEAMSELHDLDNLTLR